MKLRSFFYTLLFGILISALGTVILHGALLVWGNPESRTYNCRLTIPEKQVYDGDTLKDVRVLIHGYDFIPEDYGQKWPGIYITDRGIEIETDVRIAGIDTPEKRPLTKNADGSQRSVKSRQREKSAALAARQTLIDLLEKNGFMFEISDPILGKYAGRIVANVSVSNVDVAAYLIRQGLAKPYEGGTKPSWNFGD